MTDNKEAKAAFFAGLSIAQDLGSVIIIDKCGWDDKIWHAYCRYTLMGTSKPPRLKDLL